MTVAVGLGEGIEVVDALGDGVGLWDSEAIGVGDAATGSNCFV